MTEHEMIDLLEHCLLDAETAQLNTRMARMYFRAGEELEALLELEHIQDLGYVSEHTEAFEKIRNFMGNPPDR